MNNEMSFSIRKDSKRNYSFSALVILLFFMFAAVARSEAQTPRIFVCNEGTIPIYVASLRINRPFLSTYWMLEGWYEVKPDRGLFARCGVIEAEGTTHLVFGISNSDKEFGVVKYEFDNACLDCNFKEKEMCVKNDAMDYTSSSVTYLPPCPDGFKAVPTSQSVYAQGNATLTLTVRPSPNDYSRIAVYLSERKKPLSPRTTTPQPTPPIGTPLPSEVHGTWVGTSRCGQDLKKFTILITDRFSREVNGFLKYDTEPNSATSPPHLMMKITYDGKTRRIVLRGTTWTMAPDPPEGPMVELVGTLSRRYDGMSGKVTGGGCSTFSLRKKTANE